MPSVTGKYTQGVKAVSGQYAQGVKAVTGSTAATPATPLTLSPTGIASVSAVGTPTLAVPTTYFQDTFSGTAGTGIAAHAPEVGGSWTASVAWLVLDGSGHLYQSVEAGAVTANAEASAADGQIAYTFSTPASGLYLPHFLFRFVDASNYWRVLYNASLATLYLQEVTGGSLTTRDSGSLSLTAGASYVCNVTLSGNDMQATLGGLTLGYASSAHATATKLGLLNYDNGASYGTVLYDEVLMTS